MIAYEQWRALLTGVRLPAALVDLDAFDRNVATLDRLASAGGKTIRLASKSIRAPDLLRRAMDASPRFRGVMCYSAEEAAWLATLGFDDLLVAYPVWQDHDARALGDAHAAGRLVHAVVDSADGVRRLAEAVPGLSPDRPLSLVVDVDASLRPAGGAVHLGVRRSPNRTVGDVLRLVDHIAATPGVRFGGVMVYEAQVAGLADRNPHQRLQWPVLRQIRSVSARRIAALRAAIAAALRGRGVPFAVFNGAGTGSFGLAAREDSLTELTAGSALYCPHLFDHYSNIRFEPAAFFALQVTRSSDPGYVTCLGGGYVASGAPGWDKVPIPHLPAGLALVSTEGCGEVQTPLRVPAGVSLRPGDPVLMRHAKAGELGERFDVLHLVAGGERVGEARTYRGHGRCFL